MSLSIFGISNMLFRIIVAILSFSASQSFLTSRRLPVKNVLFASGVIPEKEKYTVGENIPEEISKQVAIYDMILVERFSAPPKTESGLWMPQTVGKDRKHLAYVISVPSSYGLESEQGRLQPIEKIAPYKAGDIVWVTDPWGIGPKDQEVGERCFSFHKADHISAVMRNE
mmetsp:Transcript_26192/g.26437  ORF Transcript_26192/g.26437 Transcript_26192/m.26437 type:complete len:170 (+) Transcript_26192:44-553(+)|eukprot:CAMPEP_0182428040 /NCGR_PEP_ID=MMETSP1167-20130531/20975_1 /TAXON_ID=2988 /ORGANISM="Mallomonas Sp, Strain CCMP3275" /LENGTH=169 /DNA_ID=CAMNT_0024610679 /DNA_START=44 /DNA_END=553 /DNA_ORIENTATION=-